MEGFDLDILLVQLKDGREEVRVKAIKTLGLNPDKLALSPLLGCLSDSSARVRYEALRSLEPLLESSHQKAILDLFEDPSRMVRLSAVRLIGKTPSRLVFGPLLEMLADPDSDVRSLASYALSKYSDKYVGRMLDELASSHWLKKNQVFQTMVLMGNRSHESISKALREKNLAREKQYWLIRLCGEFRLKSELSKILEMLGELKSSRDYDLLEALLECLGKLGSHEGMKPLLDFLDHPIARIREASIQALALQGEHAVSLLLSKLDDTSRPIRVSSARGLAKIGDLSVAPLLDNFYQKDREGRFWILQALRNLNVAVVQSIFQSLCYDEDPDLQVLSLASLAQYPADDETLFIILDLLEHDQWKVRNEACNTLARLEGVGEDFFINHLSKGTPNRKFWMIRVMQKRAANSFMIPLIEVLMKENWDLKIAACEALQGFHNYDHAPFFDALRDADDNGRYWITKALIGSKDPEAMEIMKGFLDTQHLGIRQNAIAFFRNLGPRVAPFLQLIFREKHSRRVYSVAIDLIAELKQDRQKIMLELLSSSHKEEVYWGSILAGKIGSKALTAVHELLESTDWKLRSNGLVAVKQIGSIASMNPVTELLEDEYFSIRKMAVSCLGTIGDKRALVSLLAMTDSEDLELRLKVFEALANLKIDQEEVRKLFLTGLQDENWLIQKEALKGISVLRSAEFVPALLNYWKTIPVDLTEDFLEAIGSFGSKSFEDLLLSYLDHSDSRLVRKAISAIGKISGFSRPASILDMLDHEEWEIQKEAIDALGTLKAKESIPTLKAKLEGADPVLKHHIKSCLREILGPEVWEKLLKEFIKSSRHEQAQKFYGEAREEVSKQNWKRAVSLLRKACALEESSTSLHLLARSYAELKDYEQAERCFLKILKNSPQNLKVLCNLSMVYFLKGEKARVEEIFLRIEDNDNIPLEVSDLMKKTRAKMRDSAKAD